MTSQHLTTALVPSAIELISVEALASRESNGVPCQAGGVVEVARAGSQGCHVRTRALASTSNVRMQAVTATFGGFPAARSRSWNAHSHGLCRTPASAAK